MFVEGTATLYWCVAQSAQKQNARLESLVKALQEHGYQLHYENDLNKLCQQAMRDAQQQHSIYVLQGNPTEMVTATMRLRAISSNVGIVTLMSSHNETAFSQALLCGADAYATTDMSTTLLLAIVSSILRRISHNVVIQNESSGWVLQDEAWTVSSPNGVEINLTTTERTLFLALFEAPDGRVSHTELLGILGIDSELEKTARINRLGVVVSRLRRKFEANGLTLPLKSLHNWGYMFTAVLHRR